MKKPVFAESAARSMGVTLTRERLIRLRAPRGGTLVDLLVQYEAHRENGCDTYRIISVDEVK